MITLMKSLEDEMKVFGFTIKVWTLILLVLTTCICNGQRLMLGSQTFEKQTDFSLFSGKRVNQIQGAMAWHILKTEGQDSLLWHPVKQLIWQRSRVMQDSVSFRKLGRMLRRCLQIKLYLSRLITHSFSNRSKTGMDRPKTELAYRVPASKFTRKKLDSNERLEEMVGLDTTIDWKNTGDNSYDGEKLAPCP